HDRSLSENDERIFDERVDLVEVRVGLGICERGNERKRDVFDIQLRAELLELSHTAFSAIIRGVSIDKIRLQEFSSPDAFLFEECDPRTDVIPVWPAAHEIDHALESA